MRRGACRDYNFGQKNHWRRSVWNEVLRRTAGRERSEVILYLPGPKDEDRAVAVAKGVPTQNLIAIDREARNVTAVRANGVPAVTGDALDVLWSWPDDRPVCAVLLDFCCGITNDTLGTFDAFQRAPFRRAVCMVNFMRGRDSWSNVNRQAMDVAGLMVPLWYPNALSELEKVCDPTHRAHQFLLYHAWDIWASALGRGSSTVMPDANASGPGCRVPMPYVAQDDPSHARWLVHIAAILASFRAKLFSYRSGVLTMDSAVFEPPWHCLDGHSEITTDMRARRSAFGIASIGRRIAATLAIRTGRIKNWAFT